MDQLLLTFGDIPHHAPVLLAWVLLRHTLRPDDTSPVIRRIGNTALQLGVFKYLSTMLKGLGVSGNNVRYFRLFDPLEVYKKQICKKKILFT